MSDTHRPWPFPAEVKSSGQRIVLTAQGMVHHDPQSPGPKVGGTGEGPDAGCVEHGLAHPCEACAQDLRDDIIRDDSRTIYRLRALLERAREDVLFRATAHSNPESKRRLADIDKELGR